MKPCATNPFQFFSCIIMLGAFLWLTLGTSFLSVEQLKQLNYKTASTPNADDSEKASNGPFENATEEKTETNPTNFCEEYLKEDTEHFLPAYIPLQHNKFHFEKAFPAIYRESVSQPPEIISC